MSQIIINGQPLYQADLPEMTLAQWQALPVSERPKEWIRTDGSPCLYYENDMMPSSYPASRVTHESVSVTADGVKTWATLFGELFALIDNSKTSNRSHLKVAYSATQYEVYMPTWISPTEYMFSRVFYQGSTLMVYYATISANPSFTINGSASSSKPGAGTVISFEY